MTRSALPVLAALSLFLFPHLASAQQAEPSLSAKELAGRNLFAQSCVVCHVKTQITTAAHYGPALSKASLGGQDAIMRELISNGTPNMPGFKYHFSADQIDSIVAYLKTLPVPAPAAPPQPAAPH
jgi:mono/diheme cytochrome c family protein